MGYTPWQDPAWEFWAHASVIQALPHMRCDRLFDLHPKHCFMEERKNGFKDYFGFLKRCPIPIYMQQRYDEIPASVRFPLELIQQQWPDTKFGSMTAYMVALALYEGVTHLGLWGIDYAHKTEYEEQRANAEHWVGIARGAGVHIIIPPSSPLCHEPQLLYGYESHTPELYQARKERVKHFKKQDGPKGSPFDSARLVPSAGVSALDAAAQLRRLIDPEWAGEVAKFNDWEPDWLPKDVGVPTPESTSAQKVETEHG